MTTVASSRTAAAALCALCFAGFLPASAEQTGAAPSALKRTFVHRADVAAAGHEAVVVKAGRVHDARNDGAAPMRLVGVYVVEKDKPVATPTSGQ